jgi:YHS domain-containing protein
MKMLIVAAVALSVLSGAAGAHEGHAHGAKAKSGSVAKTAAKKARLICPVTGDKIASAKAAFGHTTYKGTTYYFCCPECKPRFDKNPAKFVKNAAKGKYEKM